MKSSYIKYAAAAFFTASLASSCFAQSHKIEMGLELGPSLISLRGNEIVDKLQEADIGYSAGFSFQYNLNSNLSLRSGVAYERKGSKYTIPLTDATGKQIGEHTQHVNFGYLTLPVLVRASFGDRWRFFLNTGPYFGFLTNPASVDKSVQFGSSSANLYKRFDMGVSAGLGFAAPITDNSAFTMELRSNIGLYNVSAVKVINDRTVKTNSTVLLLGYCFKFGAIN